MRNDRSAAASPSREQTEKRLRDFLKKRKVNFLQQQPLRLVVKQRQCGQSTWGKR
jgi:hypothetical protein